MKTARQAFMVLCLTVLLFVVGCKSFYENAGVSARLGSVTAPVEFSEPTSSVKVRALYDMDGIDFYAAKYCIAEMEYENVQTNVYFFGLIETKGRQRGKVKIQPTTEEGEEESNELHD